MAKRSRRPAHHESHLAMVARSVRIISMGLSAVLAVIVLGCDHQQQAKPPCLLCDRIEERSSDHAQHQPLIVHQDELTECNRGRWSGAHPINVAIVFQDTEAVRSLIRAGVPVDKVYDSGELPICEAVELWGRVEPHGMESGIKDIVSILIESGADVDRRDGLQFYAPLHYAVECGHFASVKLLIEHGASLDLDYPNGTTILGRAESLGNSQVIELIRRHSTADDTRSESSEADSPVGNLSNEQNSRIAPIATN
ncbi:MAG: ankyrin repeat domain-containing protein [Planctomycetaceae bacterium]|nr:ankyrin repeat domain-containing protein [Planctomycetaceae bacterium]